MKSKEEIKKECIEVLNGIFEPNGETPLWCCVSISGCVDTHIQAMTLYSEKQNASLVAENEALRKKLGEVRDFIDDVQPGCAAGEDHLQYLKATSDK